MKIIKVKSCNKCPFNTINIDITSFVNFEGDHDVETYRCLLLEKSLHKISVYSIHRDCPLEDE